MVEYGPEPDHLLRRAEYARDARELLDLVEKVRLDALAGADAELPHRHRGGLCAACRSAIKLTEQSTACFACGEAIHLGCADVHLLTCEPEQEARRPILLARRR